MGNLTKLPTPLSLTSRQYAIYSRYARTRTADDRGIRKWREKIKELKEPRYVVLWR
jgi:hypothetical protein